MIGMVVFAGLMSTFSLYIYQVIKTPNVLVDKEPAPFIIPKGGTFRSVQDTLYKYNYVQDMVSFSFMAKLMSYQENVKPGLYLLQSDMTNYEAVRMLRAGEQMPSIVTFSNARVMDDLYEPMTRNLEITAAEFKNALEDFVQTNNRGFTSENIISMFIPNTYEVYYTVTGKQLVEKMLSEYNKFWNEDRLEKAAELEMSPQEVSTLASIVQAESIKPEESPVIAGLYLNRLDRGIPLQADPTLVFASGDFTIKRVLNVHKEIDSPYNTYKNKGLPPGPINLPSINSIDAVLNHDENNYIYMCAKEDFSGYHNFTSSLAEHNANARRYQRQLSIEQRKARAAAN